MLTQLSTLLACNQFKLMMIWIHKSSVAWFFFQLFKILYYCILYNSHAELSGMWASCITDAPGLMQFLLGILDKLYFVWIADVVVRKRHQQLDEIRIIFIRTSSKTCLKKTLSCHIHPRHFTQSSSHSIRLLEMRTLPTEKLLCWFKYCAGKKYQDFILSLMAFPYSNICY